MKKIIALFMVSMALASACTKDQITQVIQDQGPTDAEIVSGLKSALEVGTDTTVVKTNKVDGYFKNEAIKILLPDEAKNTLDAIKLLPGGTKIIDDMVLSLNRAAEDAAIKAKPIFINAITSMSVADGKAILFGDSLAATSYLNTKTYTDLKTAFTPKVDSSLAKVNAKTYWTAFANVYNLVASKKLTTDLTDYATTKALDGLFHEVGLQEKSIRKDPTARVTDILKKVFSQLDKK